MTKRVALYLRVSTDGQSTDNQRRELEAAARHKGWSVVAVYCDHGISGAKGRAQRPEFDRLNKDAARGKFDVVAAWSVDRLGRSLKDLVGFLDELAALRIDLFLYQQGLDTTTPHGRAMFQVLGVFSEFERAMIRERVNAGLARAKDQGKRLGRPPVEPDRERAIQEALSRGNRGIQAIAREVGVGVSVVQRIKREMATVSAD